MTKAATDTPPMRLLIWLVKIVVFPARVFAYVVAVPLHFILEYVSRKRCPRCGKKNLSGALVRDEANSKPYHFGICMSCHSQYRYVDGKWEYTGQFEEII